MGRSGPLGGPAIRRGCRHARTRSGGDRAILESEQSLAGYSPTRLISLFAASAGIAVLYAILAECGAAWGWLLAAVAIGCMCGAVWTARFVAPGVGAVSVMAGLFLYRMAFSDASLTARLLALPAYFGGDIAVEATDHYYKALVRAAFASSGHTLAALIVAPAVAALCAWAVHWSRTRLSLPRWTGSAIALGVLGLVFVLGAMQPDVMAELRSPPLSPNGGHDGYIYRSTYLNMKSGSGYYESITAAAAVDPRLMATASVRGGRFYGWAISPSHLRPPALFYAWTILTPNPLGLFYLGTAISLLAMGSVYLGLRRYVGEAAVLSAFAVLPMLQGSLVWTGLFFPDAWAGVFTLLAVGLWLQRRFRSAMVVALLAAISRDLALLALVVFTVYAAYRWLRSDAEWRGRAVVGLSLLATFVAVYLVHVSRAGAYIANADSSADAVLAMLGESSSRTFALRALSPVCFQGFTWWLLYVPPVALMPMAAAGWIWSLRSSLSALVPVACILAVWGVVLISFGAHSSYWGLLFMPLVYAGAGALVACAAATSAGGNPWRNAARAA